VVEEKTEAKECRGELKQSFSILWGLYHALATSHVGALFYFDSTYTLFVKHMNVIFMQVIFAMKVLKRDHLCNYSSWYALFEQQLRCKMWIFSVTNYSLSCRLFTRWYFLTSMISSIIVSCLVSSSTMKKDAANSS
jgi:hypothetical protein